MAGPASGQYRSVWSALSRSAKHLRSVPLWTWAGLGYVLAFVSVTWPLTSRFTHATYGGPGDGWALIWQTRFRLEHGVSYFEPTFSTDIAWPLGADYVSSLLLSNAAMELPNMLLLVLGIGDVAAYNLVVLAAAAGSSLAMFVCLRRIGCSAPVAFWGGLAYLLAPWHLEKLSIHPTLATLVAFPLLLLGVIEWARQPDFRSGALIVGATVLATYTHSYYGVAAGLFLSFAVPVVLVAAWRRAMLRRIAVSTTLLAPLIVLVPAPLVLALLLQQEEVSVQLERPVYDIAFTARPHMYLLPAADNPIFGDFSQDFVTDRALRPNEGELALYVGMLTISLAIAGLVVAARGGVTRLGAALAATMALLGVVLSLPAEIAGAPMPITYLNDALRFISTPTRFFALTLTGLIVLAALGLQGLTRPLRQPLAIGLVAVACLLSALELPFRRDPFVFDTRSPELVQLIEERVPEGAAVAQYPSLTRDFGAIGNQLFYQVDHGRPLLNGAPPATYEDGVRASVENKFDPDLGPKLALLGFRWATYDSRQGLQFGDSLETVRGYEPPPGLEIVKRLPEGSVLMRVTAKPAANLAGIATGFDRRDRWMMSPDATILVCASAAGPHALRFPVGAYAQTRLFTLGNSKLMVVPADARIHTVTARVRLRAGWQILQFRLVGSKPVRPSDLFPGNIDTRPLVMSVGEIVIRGPRGDPAVCARPPEDRGAFEEPIRSSARGREAAAPL